MIRCALCREPSHQIGEYVNLMQVDDVVCKVGGGWRCIDQNGCKRRVREIIDAHIGLAALSDG